MSGKSRKLRINNANVYWKAPFQILLKRHRQKSLPAPFKLDCSTSLNMLLLLAALAAASAAAAGAAAVAGTGAFFHKVPYR
jgi:hypothetical protein